jgi:hypothetical protein
VLVGNVDAGPVISEHIDIDCVPHPPFVGCIEIWFMFAFTFPSLANLLFWELIRLGIEVCVVPLQLAEGASTVLVQFLALVLLVAFSPAKLTYIASVLDNLTLSSPFYICS